MVAAVVATMMVIAADVAVNRDVDAVAFVVAETTAVAVVAVAVDETVAAVSVAVAEGDVDVAGGVTVKPDLALSVSLSLRCYCSARSH